MTLPELKARYDLTDAQVQKLQLSLEALADHPAPPTAVTDIDEAIDTHIADSLVGLELDIVCGAKRLADIGSGAGFPALPLAIALPGVEVFAIDGEGSKTSFVDYLARAAGIANLMGVHTRVEEWNDGMEDHDLVTSRALAPLSVVLEYSAPLLIEGGYAVAWKGALDDDELEAGARASALLGLELIEIRKVEPFVDARDRHLCIYRKVAPTPSRFPRRAGVATKRPL